MTGSVTVTVRVNSPLSVLEAISNTKSLFLITTRVRSTREGNAYTWEYLSTWRGGYPRQPDRECTPIQNNGVTQFSPMGWGLWEGYQLGCMGVPTHQGMDGDTPSPQSGWMGTPTSGWMGVLPPPGRQQHNEYLICSGQYTPCGHSGGLSCLNQLLLVLLRTSKLLLS